MVVKALFVLTRRFDWVDGREEIGFDVIGGFGLDVMVFILVFELTDS